MGEFGILLIKGSASCRVFGLALGHVCDFGSGSGSAKRTVGGDDLLLGVVGTDSEDLRLGFRLDLLGLNTKGDEDEDVLEL